MTERISALMDGEVSPDEAAGTVSMMRASAEFRESWGTYHLIGDALRGDLYLSYRDRVAERLALEPTVLSPRIQGHSDSRPARYALSAAASLAAIAFVVWTAAPITGSDLKGSGIATAARVPSQSAASNVPTGPEDARHDVDSYLFAHQGFSPANAMHGVAPYIRLVADQPSGRAR